MRLGAGDNSEDLIVDVEVRADLFFRSPVDDREVRLVDDRSVLEFDLLEVATRDDVVPNKIHGVGLWASIAIVDLVDVLNDGVAPFGNLRDKGRMRGPVDLGRASLGVPPEGQYECNTHQHKAKGSEGEMRSSERSHGAEFLLVGRSTSRRVVIWLTASPVDHTKPRKSRGLRT